MIDDFLFSWVETGIAEGDYNFPLKIYLIPATDKITIYATGNIKPKFVKIMDLFKGPL